MRAYTGAPIRLSTGGPTEPELVELCRSRLAHYKCPEFVDSLDSFPKTGTGKILKRELRKLYAFP
jgi:long-chain acyl-CoA synthetase